MNGTWSVKIAIIATVLLCSFVSIGQEVHVTPGSGNVTLSVAAQKPYQLIGTEVKRPVLSVVCAQNGKKVAHIVKFAPGGVLADESLDFSSGQTQHVLAVTIDGHQQATSWASFGDPITLAYYGKTEPERMNFIQFLLHAKTVSIDFKPFLTGMPTTSVFDVSLLGEEYSKHPECMAK